jgi:hypothetical protein
MHAAQIADGLGEREHALINRELGVCEAQRVIEDASAEDETHCAAMELEGARERRSRCLLGFDGATATPNIVVDSG